MTLAGFIQKISRVPVRLIAKVLFGVKACGLENVGDVKSPFIVAANHVGRVDPYLAGFFLPKHIFYGHPVMRFPAYQGYMDKFFLGAFLKIWGAYAIQQGSKRPLSEVLKESVKVLKNGECLMIFPEGKMVFLSGEKVPARPGVAYLAKETGAPIIPVLIKRKRRRHFFSKYSVYYGKPFFYTDIAEENDDLREAAGKVMEKIFLLKISTEL